MNKKIKWDTVLFLAGIICLVIFGVITYRNDRADQRSRQTIEQLRSMKEISLASKVTDGHKDGQGDVVRTSYDRLFEQNPDMAAWLNIPDTQIDYPVMQTMQDEEYYLRRNFYGEADKNGCLLLDTDSDISQEGANLIIHGHNMKSGAMFGTLEDYQDQEYGMSHRTMYLYTRDELREYELIAVFYSKVYSANDQVFKYYQYFGGADEDSFNDFCYNIKKMSIYDTGVDAEYMDEFLTLSTCAYHTKNGRFVVVAKRIKK